MAEGSFDPDAIAAGWFDDEASAEGWFAGGLTSTFGVSSDVLEGGVYDGKDWTFLALGDTGLTLSGVALSLGVTQTASNPSGGYTVKVGKRRFNVDPLDSMSLRAVIDAVQDEAEEVAQVVEPVARPAVVARAQVAPVEVPKTNREDAKAFAKFLAQVRSEYEAAMRTAMIIRLMREAEDDDEEALLLLM